MSDCLFMVSSFCLNILVLMIFRKSIINFNFFFTELTRTIKFYDPRENVENLEERFRLGTTDYHFPLKHAFTLLSSLAM